MNGILVDSFREDNFIFIEPISFALNSAVIDEIIFHEQAHLSFDAEDYAYGFESSELCRADKLKNADSWKLFYKYTKRF